MISLNDNSLYVKVIDCKNEAEYGDAVKTALDAFPDSYEGKKVLLKPNMLGPYPPETHIATNPGIVSALRKELLSKGADLLIGDTPGVRGYGFMERSAGISGIGEAAGNCFHNISLETREIDLPSMKSERVTVSSVPASVDSFISVPIMKTHMMTVITGAIKNSFGLVIGAEKSRMHGLAKDPESFAELILDIYCHRTPDLVIMDAVWGMEGKGPTGKDIRLVGKLIASRNGAAVDMLMSAIMGFDKDGIPLLMSAIRRGMIPDDISKLEIDGNWENLRFKKPNPMARSGIASRVESFFFNKVSKSVLKVDNKSCIKCRECEKICPVEAVKLNPYPDFDKNRCITCFCCYEVCTEHAIRICSTLGALHGFRALKSRFSEGGSK